MQQQRIRVTALAAMIALASVAPAETRAEGAADDWKFSTTIYAWLPAMGGELTVPMEGDASASLDPSDILDALNFTFMGMAEAQKGRWGAATDVIYLDLGATKNKFRDLTLGDHDLPATASAKADIGLSGWVWTLGGTYQLVEEPAHPLVFLAGARMLQLSSDLTLKFEGDITGLPVTERTVKGDVSQTNWDAIVGLKGRFAFGGEQRWFVPYYLDVGTGDSDLTWQGMAGVGYAFEWGELVAVWRYLDYNFASGDAAKELWVNGAAFGATFRF